MVGYHYVLLLFYAVLWHHMLHLAVVICLYCVPSILLLAGLIMLTVLHMYWDLWGSPSSSSVLWWSDHLVCYCFMMSTCCIWYSPDTSSDRPFSCTCIRPHSWPVSDMVMFCTISPLYSPSVRFSKHLSQIVTLIVLCTLLLLLLLLLLSGPRAYAPDAPQPCRLIVLPSYYSRVFDVPTFVTGPSSSSM